MASLTFIGCALGQSLRRVRLKADSLTHVQESSPES